MAQVIITSAYRTPVSVGSYIATAVEFDGVNDGYQRSGDLTSNANSSEGTVSFLFKLNSLTGSDQQIYGMGNGRFKIHLESTDNLLYIQAIDTSVATVIDLKSDLPILPVDGWQHVLFSWSLTSGLGKFFINDTEQTTNANFATTANPLSLLSNNHYIGQGGAGSVRLDGCMADFYFNSSEYIDLSIEVNRRKFIDVDGKPVELGATGQLPTGNQPIMLFSGDSVTFGDNSGFGGTFNAIGTLTDCADSPSNPSYITTAVEFDGAGDNIQRFSPLTGAADGQVGTVAFSMKVDSTAAVRIQKLYDSRTSIYLTSGGALVIQIAKPGSGTALLSLSTTAILPKDIWVSVVASWDVSLANGGLSHLWINEVDDVPTSVASSELCDYTDTSVRMGGGGTQRLQACVADFYFNFNEYIDFSIEANRRLFFDTNNKPVDLGVNGEIPTGTAPIIFLKGGAADFIINKGTGGDFVDNDVLTDCATSPSI